MKRQLLFWLVLILLRPAFAHIGSPNVFFEGQAGPYPVRVTVRPPGVIPGLAEISVRVAAGRPDRIAALPIHWNVGKKGAPPPDEARLVRGETNLYTAELWFMKAGAESVEVQITGDRGPGSVVVPVNAVAVRRLAMPRFLGGLLVLLGALLVALGVTIVSAAIRQSVLRPGIEPDQRNRWRFRVSITLTVIFFLALVWLGKRWWGSEDADYRNNRLFRPLEASAQAPIQNGQRRLRLNIEDEGYRRAANNPPLVPDHGKLMHLFLVREPLMDAFAHLHPVMVDRLTFETALPDLPAGNYRVYADVTLESGFTHTLTAPAQIPEAPTTTNEAASGPLGFDPDDSWQVSVPRSNPTDSADRTEVTSELSPEYSMTWLQNGPLTENREVQMHFAVRSTTGQPVPLEPYMGMLSHAVVRRDDGSVFTHLHPSGSVSMAALQLATLRVEGKLPLAAAFGKDEAICKLPSVAESQPEWLRMNAPGGRYSFSIPYEFPKAGSYRLWVQVKIKGRVHTGVYDVLVRAANAS
jgi:hypothetical protein